MVNVTVIDMRAGGEPKMFGGGEDNGSVARFSGAHNERTKDRAGETKDEATWMGVVAFGAAARFVEKYVHTGSHLLISGSLHNRTYEQDGQKRTVTELHVVPGRGKIDLLDATAKTVDAIGGKPAASESAGQPAL